MVAVHGFRYHAAALLSSGNPDINPAVPLDCRGASMLGLWDIIYNLYIARKKTNKHAFSEPTLVPLRYLHRLTSLF